jgi:subtilisin-like proprotein convertase family protein
MKRILTALLLVLGPGWWLTAQSEYRPWSKLNPEQTDFLETKKQERPWKETYDFQLDLKVLQACLQQVQLEKSATPTYLSLPLSNKKVARFRLEPSAVLPEALARKFPNIQTFKGISLDGQAYQARFSWTSKGFHGIIGTPEGTYFIDPHPSGEKNIYTSYSIKNNVKPGKVPALQCGTDDLKDDYNAQLQAELVRMFLDGPQLKANTQPLRKYIIAIAATAEYTEYHGGTVEDALEAIVILVNRLNQVLERDMGILLELAAENDQIIFLDATTDPYTNGDSGKMLEENANYLSVAFGAEKYDLGHVVGTNTSLNGIAYTGVVCVNTIQKAGGVSTMPQPEGDPFTIAVFGHEVGHQFGASHSFSSCHNLFQPTSYEPGGGTTIMSYAGICDDAINNLQNTSDDYYHTISLQQMLFLTREGSARSCAELVPTANLAPEVDIPFGNDFYIPVATPFKLSAQAFDANGDSLTYCWEQFDLGPLNSPPGAPVGNSPLFRSLPPNPSPTRYFPMLQKVVEAEYDRSEVLPTYDRDLTFRCTVRDNNPESGAVNWEEVRFRSSSSAGPFKVLSHAQPGIQWEVGDLKEIRWDVANTDNDTVNCQYVNILMSTNGGQDFDKILLENTPNDGSAMVVIPNYITQRARIMVEAADNIFFDIADNNFEIWPPTKPTYYLNVTPSAIPQLCLPEAAEYSIQYNALVGFDQPISFNLIGDLPKGSVVEFSEATVRPTPEMQEVILKIYIDDMISDTFDVQVQIISEELDTAYRDLRLITRSNDFSELQQLSPVDGAVGLSTISVDFSWTNIEDAESYTFELATSPAFGDSMIYTSSQLADTTVSIENLFEPNTLYFWRVRGNNSICGSGAFLEPNVFQTVSTACNTYSANDLPINISGTGRPTIQSTISVPEGGAIEKVNIPIIDVNYQPIKSLRFTLISPEGQQAILYDQGCGNTVRFLSGFDDEANSAIECPPDDGLPFRPVDSLEQYIGTTAAGDWTLQVQVVESGFGASGGLSKWSIEFCSELNPSPPTLLLNDTLKMAPGIERFIDSDFLFAEDPKFVGADLNYQLLSLPLNGTLLLDQEVLAVGSQFSQADINSGRLSYLHSDNGSAQDQFSFLIQNPEGGWINKEQFNILIDETFVTNTEELEEQWALQVFPNPADQQVRLLMDLSEIQGGQLEVFDGLGRRVYQQKLTGLGIEMIEIPTIDWPSGLFFFQIRSSKGAISRKVLIQHP